MWVCLFFCTSATTLSAPYTLPMIVKTPAIIAFLFFFQPVFPQRIATFKVAVPPGYAGIPVSVGLDDITDLSESELILTEVSGNTRTPVPIQVNNFTLHWMVQPGKVAREAVYELAAGEPASGTSFRLKYSGGNLILGTQEKNFLSYRFETMYPPAGVDSAYARSGFIHPLWSPHGQVLTRVQPKDHYHHYGIWNPWTHVLYKGDTVDFWNLRSRQGTVRFAGFKSTTSGTVFGEYTALHEHVVFRNDSEEVALNELQTVRVYYPGGGDYYLVDLEFNMQCATENPVRLLEYRYGGFGWRTTEEWTNKNSSVLSSEGKTRKDADGSKARWCIVQGEVGGDHAGVLMMSYPSNYNHPEPLRIWPENQYGRGDMFANFSPTKDKDWPLEPGEEYVLKYRLVVFNGAFTKEQADAAWESFATPPEITVLKD